MPHDLFGDVVVRPRAVRARRSSLVILSVVAHGSAIIAAVIVPLLATDLLPALPQSVTFIPDRSVLPVVRAAGPLRVSRSHPPADNQPIVLAPAAPIESPASITQESCLEDPAGAVESAGSGPGVSRSLASVGVVYPQPAPPLPPPPPSPVHIHEGIRASQKLVDVTPIYPRTAQLVHVEGVVVIEATIDARGNVIAARVLKSIALLDQAAVDAVSQWKYTPTLLNGVPVAVVMTVTVNFKLR